MLVYGIDVLFGVVWYGWYQFLGFWFLSFVAVVEERICRIAVSLSEEGLLAVR